MSANPPAPAPAPANPPASQPVLTAKTVEDWLLFLAPIIGGAAGLDWGGIIPGMSGFLVGALFASLSKSIIGLGQNLHGNYEDGLSFAITFLGTLATVFSANMSYAVYGLIIGFFVKALGMLKPTIDPTTGKSVSGINIEDLLLAAGAIIAGFAQLTGNPIAVNAGLLIAIIGKALPSIGTNGSPAVLITTPAPT
jgi:tetrahydromethanopterin S-methyltransferase subunit F